MNEDKTTRDYTFIYFDTKYDQLDKRPNKVVNEEINLSMLGILGYNFEDSMNFIKENSRLCKKFYISC